MQWGNNLFVGIDRNSPYNDAREEKSNLQMQKKKKGRQWKNGMNRACGFDEKQMRLRKKRENTKTPVIIWGVVLPAAWLNTCKHFCLERMVLVSNRLGYRKPAWCIITMNLCCKVFGTNGRLRRGRRSWRDIGGITG